MATSRSNRVTGEVQRDSGAISPNAKASPPQSGAYSLDDTVKDSFPIQGTTVLQAQHYGESLWKRTVKLKVELPSGERDTYFVKLDETGCRMCEGEFESLKEIYGVSATLVPRPYAWGTYLQENTNKEVHFLLTEFREVGEKPAEPVKLANRLADLHLRSVSPTGKFGFHMATNHGKIIQAVGAWEKSWSTLYSRHLEHFMGLAKSKLEWPEFNAACDLTLEKVVPRLLLPLQSEGRTLKPCLLHGNCWDGNTAMDKKTDEAFVFDVCSFYGHNEYDTGNWRAPRHRLSHPDYIKNYKLRYPPSEPVEDWSARNILYSLTFNMGNIIQIAGSTQRQVVYEDMLALCKLFFPEDLRRKLQALGATNTNVERGDGQEAEQATAGAEAPEEEEEEEEMDWK